MQCCIIIFVCGILFKPVEKNMLIYDKRYYYKYSNQIFRKCSFWIISLISCNLYMYWPFFVIFPLKMNSALAYEMIKKVMVINIWLTILKLQCQGVNLHSPGKKSVPPPPYIALIIYLAVSNEWIHFYVFTFSWIPTCMVYSHSTWI